MLAPRREKDFRQSCQDIWVVTCVAQVAFQINLSSTPILHLAESEVALVAAAKRLSLDADEGRVTATVSRAGVVNPTSSARRSPPRRPLRRHQHHEARLLRRSGAMTGDDELDLSVNFSEIESLRHFVSERDLVGWRGREMHRRVGQQLDVARPFRRSLTTAGGDDDVELSVNLRRLDLGGAEEDVGRTVQGSASISSSSAAGVLGVVEGALCMLDVEQTRAQFGRSEESRGSVGNDERVSLTRAGSGDAATARRFGAVAPRRTGVVGMEEILSENQYVAREMERRDFQLREGQWVDGVLLPGDPLDDAELESFLRRQFREQQAAARSSVWGPGRKLGSG